MSPTSRKGGRCVEGDTCKDIYKDVATSRVGISVQGKFSKKKSKMRSVLSRTKFLLSSFVFTTTRRASEYVIWNTLDADMVYGGNIFS